VIAEANLKSGWHLLYYVLAITTALTVLRFSYVAVSARLAGLRAARRGVKQTRAPLRMIAAFAFAGVRGAITLAGVLTLPLALADGSPFPGRNTAISLAMGVILFSLVLAAVVLPFLLRDLEVVEVHAGENDEATRALLIDVALERIEAARADGSLAVEAEVFNEAASHIITHYRRMQQDRSLDLEAVEQTRAQQVIAVERSLHLIGVRAQREELRRLRRMLQLSEESATRLTRELDLLEMQLSAAQRH
jgi:CPA1 family monovalent cation:H+ antiporter